MDAAIVARESASRINTLDFESIISTGFSNAMVAELVMVLPFIRDVTEVHIAI